MDDYFPGSLGRLIAWKESQPPVCWVCGYDWRRFNRELRRGPQVHHIQRQSSCYPNYKHVECNLFMACETCHMGPLAAMEHAKQLAYKLLRDERHFRLELWHHCRDGPNLRSAVRVTMDEVMSQYARIGVNQ